MSITVAFTCRSEHTLSSPLSVDVYRGGRRQLERGSSQALFVLEKPLLLSSAVSFSACDFPKHRFTHSPSERRNCADRRRAVWWRPNTGLRFGEFGGGSTWVRMGRVDDAFNFASSSLLQRLTLILPYHLFFLIYLLPFLYYN